MTDYAEVQFRGFIEGYYGNPWSLEDRIDLMKFGGEIKMNQYVFAPKDDPYPQQTVERTVSKGRYLRRSKNLHRQAMKANVSSFMLCIRL